MLARKLIDREGWYITVNWLGMGAFEVSHYPTGRYARASRELKSQLLNVMEALRAQGVPPDSGTPTADHLFLMFGRAALSPGAPDSINLQYADPVRVADVIIRMLASEEAPSF